MNGFVVVIVSCSFEDGESSLFGLKFEFVPVYSMSCLRFRWMIIS